MRTRFLLVFNPLAGIAGRRLVERVAEALEAKGAKIVRATPTTTGPDLSLLEREPFDAVIAAGGDGTFRALAKAIGTRLPLCFLPMGTGNVLAHEIGLPRGPVAMADVFMHGPVVEIEGAQANGEPFFLMAGAGFDGEVIARLDTPLKRRIGKAAYVKPVLAALALQPQMLQVEIDGRPHEAGWVVVTRARRYGGAFTIARDASIMKPGLTAVLFKSASRLARLRQLTALGTGLIAKDPGIAHIPCRHVRITSSTPQAVEIDGDPFGATPLDVTAGGARAALIVPAAYRG